MTDEEREENEEKEPWLGPEQEPAKPEPEREDEPEREVEPWLGPEPEPAEPESA